MTLGDFMTFLAIFAVVFAMVAVVLGVLNLAAAGRIIASQVVFENDLVDHLNRTNEITENAVNSLVTTDANYAEFVDELIQHMPVTFSPERRG